MEKIKIKVIKSEGRGIIHDSRADVRNLAKMVNLLIDKVNTLVDEINDLKSKQPQP